MKKRNFRTGNLMVLLLVVGGLIGALASWTTAKSDKSSFETPKIKPIPARFAENQEWSKAILSVRNMSCGGCVDTIKKSLAPLPGIGAVSVDLASATAEVLFDPGLMDDPQKIARAITAGGYPATVDKILSARELYQEGMRLAKIAETRIATVGQLDILRRDFNIELGHARSRYEKIYGSDVFSSPQGQQVLQSLKVQVALRLIDDGIKMQEVQRAGYQVENAVVDQALSVYMEEKQTSLDRLKLELQSINYPFDYFKGKFSQKIRLQHYLDEIVLASSLDSNDRQQRYADWLANARSLAKIVYYDKELGDRIKAGSGSSCGAGGSGGCPVSGPSGT